MADKAKALPKSGGGDRPSEQRPVRLPTLMAEMLRELGKKSNIIALNPRRELPRFPRFAGPISSPAKGRR